MNSYPNSPAGGPQAFQQPVAVGAPSSQRPATAPILELDVSLNLLGFKLARPIVATVDEFRYAKKRIALADIESVSYYAVNQSINGIPSTTEQFVILAGNGAKVRIHLSSSRWKKKTSARHEQVFQQLVSYIARYVEPRVVHRLIAGAHSGKPIVVGGLELAPAGITQRRRVGGDKFMPWSDLVGTTFSQGFVVVFQSDPGSPAGHRKFFSTAMRTENAVLLRPLLQQCSELWQRQP